MKKWRCKNCAFVSFLQLQEKCHLCRRIRTNHTQWLLKEILVLEKLLFYSLLWNIKTLSKSVQNQSKNGRICKYVWSSDCFFSLLFPTHFNYLFRDITYFKNFMKILKDGHSCFKLIFNSQCFKNTTNHVVHQSRSWNDHC